MTLLCIERLLRLVGALTVAVFLASVFAGLARAERRPRGRLAGSAGRALHWPLYVLIGIPFFGAAILLWRALPIELSPVLHVLALAFGTLLTFPGLALALWGRLALGAMYNVSLSAGAQLFADHRLITSGPYALVRHPIYSGLVFAAWGALLLYRTWTCALLALLFFGLAFRARREEALLAAEFGAEWEAYRRRVPGWVPRWRPPRS